MLLEVLPVSLAIFLNICLHEFASLMLLFVIN